MYNNLLINYLMKELTLVLTVEEANIILDSLGNMPFRSVYQLVGKIQAQAGEQLGADSQANEIKVAPSNGQPISAVATAN